MKKILFMLIGIISLILGVLGIILPILPTTPFFLLALYCFSKGHKKFNQWFCKTSFFTKYISKYTQTKSLTIKQKLLIQIPVGVIMAITFILFNNPVVRVILALSFIIHNYIFIVKIETSKPKTFKVKS